MVATFCSIPTVTARHRCSPILCLAASNLRCTYIGHASVQRLSMQQIRYALIIMVRNNAIPVATACRVLKISRKTAYKWLQRYASDPINSFKDRCRRPHSCPKALGELVKQRIIDVHNTTWLGPRGVRRQLQQMLNTAPSLISICRVLQAANGKTEVSVNGDLPSSLETLCLESKFHLFAGIVGLVDRATCCAGEKRKRARREDFLICSLPEVIWILSENQTLRPSEEPEKTQGRYPVCFS